MACPKCGAELRPHALFCHRCGRRVEAPVAEPTRAPALDFGATAPASPPAPPDPLDAVIAAETRELSLGALNAPENDPPAPPPLSPGVLIAERYAVVALVATTRDANRYTVTDVIAGQVCWECATPLAAAADERFCAHCGAERRETRLTIREQRLTPARFAAPLERATFVEIDRVYTLEDETEVAAPTEDAPDIAEVPPASSPLVALNALLRPVAEDAPMPARPPEGVVHAALAPPPAAAPEQNDAPTIEVQFFTPPSAAPSRLRVSVGVATDVGRARRNKPNEDTALVMTLEHAGDRAPAPITLCVVADGLGGHDDGQRAGRLAARIIAAHITQSLWLPALEGQFAREFDPVQLGEALRGGIIEANRRIVATNALEGGDMGCTVTALLAQGGAACVANVGDSRTYHFLGRDLSKVTVDHSLVARLVAANMLAPADVYTHPQRSQIYRSLGDEAELAVDLFPRRLECGDTFLLCSDGLWEMVRDPDIATLLYAGQGEETERLARRLVEAANDHGGEDNVSVIVARVVA